jgi:bacterioferritin-associated ferredoxin
MCNYMQTLQIYIVTCRHVSKKQVDEYVSWDTKMKDVDSWKPARCCGIKRRVHGYE